MEPENQFYGDVSYRAFDPEGHSWTFSTHVREVSKADAADAELSSCSRCSRDDRLSTRARRVCVGCAFAPAYDELG